MFRVFSIIFFVCVVFFLPFFFRSDSVKFDASIKTSVIFLCIGIFMYIYDKISIAKSRKCSTCNRNNATQIVSIDPIVKLAITKNSSYTVETGDFEIYTKKGKVIFRPVKETRISTGIVPVYVARYNIGCRFCNDQKEYYVEKDPARYWFKSLEVETKKLNNLPFGGIVDFGYPFKSDYIQRIHQRKPWPLG